MTLINFFIVLIFLFTSNLFSSHFDDLLQDLLTVESQESDTLLEKTKQAAQKLDEAVSKNTEKLQELAEQKSLELQEKAESETKKITQRYVQEATKLQQAVEKQSAEIKKNATEQILSLIAQAEAAALKAKQQTRKKLLEEKIDGFITSMPSDSWKDRTRKEFSQDLQFLKEIITQGETPHEAKDFLNRLQNQEQWMDTTLATTQKQSDESYVRLVQKKQLLERIVQSQKDAEALLKHRIESVQKALPNYSRLRLLLLYYINDTLQKENAEAGIPSALSDEEQTQLVERVIVAASKEAMPVIDESVKQELDKTKITAGKRLEAFARENLDQHSIIIDTKDKLSITKKELNLAKKEVFTQRTGKLLAEKKVDLISELADRRVSETKNTMDTKRTFLNEQMLTLTQKEKFLDENKAWVEKLIQSLTQKTEQAPSEQAPAESIKQESKEDLIMQQEQTMRRLLEQELAKRSNAH